MANKKVSNLKIYLQKNSDNVYVATWDFNASASKTTSSSGVIKAGDWVTIKSSCTKYSNGVKMPSDVKSRTWKVKSVNNSSALLGGSKDGKYKNLNSRVALKYLTKSGSSSSSTKTTDTLDHYKVYWYYATGDGIWYSASGSPSSSGTKKYDTYSPPSNASKIKVKVAPIAKKHKVNKTEVYYWKWDYVSETYNISAPNLPEKPSAPNVKIENYKLTATVDNITDSKTDYIQFRIYDGQTLFNTSDDREVEACMVTYSIDVNAGGSYRVQCRAVNKYGNNRLYSDWSDFAGEQGTIPSTPSEITTCRAESRTSVYLEWGAVDTAKSYDIEYATKKEYLDGSNSTSTITSVTGTSYIVNGLESGQEYFFRVRAVNIQGTSSWSGIVSVILGREPSAPTTWSSTTTVVTGEALILYWVHNAQDSSSETKAELELTINGVTETHTITKSTAEDEKDKTSFYTVDTTSYIEGTTILWRVRTAGVTGAYGDWSVQRTVDIYAPATLALSATDASGSAVETLTSFPLYISGIAGPNSQSPVSFHLTVISNETYETIDNVGNSQMINEGEEVYSQHFDISENLSTALSANNINLENGISYTVKCTVSMNSGLSADASLSFTVSWSDAVYSPDAEIGVDEDTYVAYIRPYCENYPLTFYAVTFASDEYTRTAEVIDDPNGDMIIDAYTTTGEEVYSYTDTNGNTAYYCRVYAEEGIPIETVRLSVYRREFDGTFTEIATDIDQTRNEYILDPHPSLDYARYRIVAVDQTTGAVSYTDLPGQPINSPYVVIQWDETWSYFATDEENPLEKDPWSGSMLKLPFNVDVAEDSNPDVTLTEYIGRSHPVSYYGTQLGSSATWNIDIDKKDTETLYGLRRLQRYMGDVYVREPSGSGYWANIKVSFNQKHTVLVIPVTLIIYRVEGGK